MVNRHRLARGLLLGSTLVLGVLVACGSPADERPRCVQCGMFADAAPQWAARAEARGEETLHFDSPKCLLRYAAGRGANSGLTLTMTEYYTQQARPADALVYVRGSDLRSPMGADLVPLADRAAADEFARDHGGSVLTFAEITAEVLAELDH